MQIERGMQPNCSELVIRLSSYGNIDTVKQELESIGVTEYLYTYDWAEKIPTEWDDDKKPNDGLIAVKDLSKEVQKLLKDTGPNADEDTQQKAIKKLRTLGYDIHSSQTILLERKKKAKNIGGTVWLSPNFDNGDIAIVGHQHCQSDMFPLLKKISDHFDEEVQPYDGGSIQDYEEWLENQGD